MLPGMMGAIGGVRSRRLVNVIGKLGLASGLKLCLDAGDAASASSATAAKWVDVSGNGDDFWRGTSVSSESTDPTFNGSVGATSKNEYWSFDGADVFTYDTTNETWMNALYGDSAKFSLAAWVYFPSLTATWRLINTNVVGAGISVDLFSADDDISVSVKNNAAETVFTANGLLTPMNIAAGWNFIGLSVDEAANTIRGVRNATQVSGTCTYSNPTNGAATVSTFTIGRRGTAETTASCRIASLTMWQGVALSGANFTSLFNATRSKFGV